MTRSELVESIRQDLQARAQWDTRQGMFYQMRHHGLRRANKPWPNASDVHYPLADSAIERLKPIYFQQLFSSDQLAMFVPNAQGLQTSEHTAAAALWFDHQVKHRTNFEVEVLRAVDSFLIGGRSVIKVWWDPYALRLRFTALPAQRIIVPMWTTDFEDADRVVHVQRYTVEAYRRRPEFKQGRELEKKIVGQGDSDDSGDSSTQDERYTREGLTHTNDETIIVWEVWQRDDSGKWGFECISPLLPEEPLRSRTTTPYLHAGHPFVDFAYEEKESGWYSPRGVVEILASFEAELCKLMNEKNDAMTLYNRPLFIPERDIGSTQNLRWLPGQILPFRVTPLQMREPPVSFDQQILLIRDIGERLVNVPDFGMSQVKAQNNARTATEIAAIGQSSQQSADLRMRVFRMSLAKLYRMAWAVLKQYKADDLMMWSEERLVSVPAEAIAGEYRIEPSGSADGLTRQQGHAKAIARLQLLGASPFIDQGELTKTVLEADDPGLVKRLYKDPGVKSAEQTEEQGKEIGVMMLGFPVQVSPADDHAAHLSAILDFVMRQAQQGGQAQPEGLQMLLMHAQEHIQALAQSNPQQARLFTQAFGQIAQAQQQEQQQQDTQ